MWVRTRKGRLFNLTHAFDVYANDPRNEVGGRTYGNWTVVVRGGPNVGVLAICDSQEEADAICQHIWLALRQNAEALDLADIAGGQTGVGRSRGV